MCVRVALGVLHSKLFKDYSVTRLHALGSSGKVCFFSKVSGQRAYSRKKMVKAGLDVLHYVWYYFQKVTHGSLPIMCYLRQPGFKG